LDTARETRTSHVYDTETEAYTVLLNNKKQRQSNVQNVLYRYHTTEF